MRHPTSNKPILNFPITGDHYKCQYTGKLVHKDEAIFLGPCIPQVSGTYGCAPDAKPHYVASMRQFNDSEQNCNTCKNLVRKKHSKRKDGQLVGSCYLHEHIMFHPEDWMGKECYESHYA